MEYAISLLPLLACPLLMGGMMWLMMRMNKGEAMSSTETAQSVVTDTASGDRLSQLRGQLGELQTRQAEIAGHIELLAAEDQATESQEPATVATPGSQPLPTRRPA